MPWHCERAENIHENVIGALLRLRLWPLRLLPRGFQNPLLIMTESKPIHLATNHNHVPDWSRSKDDAPSLRYQ